MKEFNETCEKLILAVQRANLLTSAGSRSHIPPSARTQAAVTWAGVTPQTWEQRTGSPAPFSYRGTDLSPNAV